MKLFGRPVAIWNGEFDAPAARNYRISLCTTCMGRLHDLQATLPKNLEDNRDYPNVEFIVLDYNSQDGLETWIYRQMMEHIESGRLVYYRTAEPAHYSMSHSRNVAFGLATGEIVNNLDADNWTNAGFATYLNRLANQCPTQAMFAKGRRLIRGRLGFYKKEWELLGGYDESLNSYGYDDKDLMYRAWISGMTLMWFGGQYCSRIKTPRAMKTALMRNKNRKETEAANQRQSHANILNGYLCANNGVPWGAARVVKNFSEEIQVMKGRV